MEKRFCSLPQLKKQKAPLKALALSMLLMPLGLMTLNAQTLNKEWDKTFGGNYSDELMSLQQTTDGGYILGGTAQSDMSGDKSENSRGGFDYWVVKINSAGVKEWDKTFGGSDDDHLYCVLQTSDGGYMLGGFSLSGVSGDKTDTLRGINDYWVVKINSAGVKEWDKTFGGDQNEELRSIVQTSDGGYLLAGGSASDISGDRTEPTRNFTDYWLVKISSAGAKQWDKALGGYGSEEAYCLKQTSDGGYIVGGRSNSGIGVEKSENSVGSWDYWVVKVAANGTKQWDKTLGGFSSDQITSLQQTSDGGYILGGYSPSIVSGDKSEPPVGAFPSHDFWVIKIDSNGAKQWDKTYGGDMDEDLHALQQTTDGGYILGGMSTSDIFGDKSQISQGANDFWLLKIDSTGTKEWDKTFGGDLPDKMYALQQTTDGGYILGGYSSSGMVGDKSDTSRGGKDFWVIKLGTGTSAGTVHNALPQVKVFPNPVAEGRVQMLMNNMAKGQYIAHIYNSAGQQVAAHTINYKSGLFSTDMDVQHLVPGIYHLSLQNENGEQIIQQKVVKQ